VAVSRRRGQGPRRRSPATGFLEASADASQRGLNFAAAVMTDAAVAVPGGGSVRSTVGGRFLIWVGASVYARPGWLGPRCPVTTESAVHCRPEKFRSISSDMRT